MIPTILRPTGSANGIPMNEMWYYAPEQVTLHTSYDVQCHTFANGKGIIRTYMPIKAVETWLYQKSSITKVILPHSATKLVQYAFRDLSAASEIEIPSTVSVLEPAPFMGCSNLVMNSLPESLTSIGRLAFSGCYKVTFTSIPAGVVTIADGIFNACSSITSLRFMGTPQSMHQYALQNMSNLTDIYVPWAEGEVANAPWGAYYSTIHYNS